MVEIIESTVSKDGFLGMLHALLLMDNTLLLATVRERDVKENLKFFSNTVVSLVWL